MDENDRRVFYQAQWSAYLYQDGLKWSRFKTVATLEAGLIYVVLFAQSPPSPAWLALLVVVASVLVGSLTILAKKDEVDSGVHLGAIEKLESEMWPEWSAALRGGGGLDREFVSRRVERWRSFRPRGAATMTAVSLAINGVNVVFMIRTLAPLFGTPS